MYEPKFSAGLWCFGRCVDRFACGGYGPPISLEERIKRAGKTKGIEGVELHYPEEFEDLKRLKALLEENGLVVSNVNLNTFTPPKFRYGAFTARDPKIRREAIDLGKRMVEAAGKIGSPSVGLWLGQDGFDYPFQIDYPRAWELLIEGIREVAREDTSLKVGIEYKLKEPRTHILVGSVGKALLISQWVGLPNVGVVVDFGHALMGGENPADSLCLLLKEKKLVNIHFNDAYREWDDDMIPGVVNLWETVEYLYYLLHSHYQGWLGLDMFPYREDPVEACTMAVENIKGMIELAKKINPRELEEVQKSMDAIQTQKLIRKIIFE